jgi:hypothetical protein
MEPQGFLVAFESFLAVGSTFSRDFGYLQPLNSIK